MRVAWAIAATCVVVGCVKDGYARVDSVTQSPLGGTVRFGGEAGWELAEKKMAEVCGGPSAYSVGDSHIEDSVAGVDHYQAVGFMPAHSQVRTSSATVVSFTCR